MRYIVLSGWLLLAAAVALADERVDEEKPAEAAEEVRKEEPEESVAEPEEPVAPIPILHVWGDRPATPPGTVRPMERQWIGERISLSLKNADIRDVLRSFARIAGINIVIAPEVRGEVTVELKDVPWDQALHVILRTHGLGAEIDGRYWMPEGFTVERF